ncbi:oxygen-independent coproporphyrinogen III oxidase [Chitinibacteraceae bacterium HSL-7]
MQRENRLMTPFDVQALQFDRALIQRMDRNGPRYTSYPSADRFQPGFDARALSDEIARTFVDGTIRPLSLYVHVPFCNTICYYCGCNKIITNNRQHAEPYLADLDRELQLYTPLIAPHARVEQLHFGGGTPTFLSDEQLARVMTMLRSRLTFAEDGEYSIEIDPRKVSAATVAQLASLGFNRMSVGVQDFDPDVQQAVNRIQSEAETRAVIDAARAHGFKSISLDLIYGLPRQTPERFAATLARVLEIRPDRLSLYSYAHLPHLFKTQRQIAESDLPSADMKLDILALAIQTLTAAGYVYIGMDHFALPDDELAVAQRAGTLHRNFQGYSTHADIDLLALGVSAISKLGGTYSQNAKTTAEYGAMLAEGRLPLIRGYALDKDDLIRRAVIQQLMCQFALDFAQAGREWGIDAASYFADELQDLAPLVDEGLVALSPERLAVTPRGRMLIRNVAMVFDAHLRRAGAITRYSRTI